MEYKNLGNSGLRVSVVGLGCNNFGRRCDQEQTTAVVHQALDLGVTLFDTEGTVLWEAQTRDTFVVVADSVAFQAGVPYFWKVRGRTGFDRWSETELVSFTIVTATPERQ